MLSFRYTITTDDYVNYYSYVMWDAPERKKARIKSYTRQVLLNAGVIALLFYSNVFEYRSLSLYVYVGVLLILMLVQIFTARANIRKTAAKTIESDENRNIFLEQQVEVTETGIHIKNEVGDHQYSWKAFVKKQENEAYFFLFQNSLQAFIIPKRAFRSTIERNKFEQLLAEHLSFDAEVAHLLKNK